VPSSPLPPAGDYVIVGAGSAGCVLAARLTEDPAVHVTIVEAGPPDTAPEIHTPIAFGQLLKSQYDWDLHSEPEPGLGGRRCFLPRGKTLGGSSAINAMVYIRGSRADYDEWAAMGNAGWGFEDVLPYFTRSEDELAVAAGRSNHPLIDAWIRAGIDYGMAPNDDFNGPGQEGIGRCQVTQRDGLRCSTAAAYLHPAAERANLTILTGTAATRVLFEGSRAVGVEIERDGVREALRADSEVILSAGAYMSPQLLMLSGIGPGADLAALGIPVLADLPVGENLHDHVLCPLCWTTDEETLLTAGTPEHLERFARERQGPLTSNVVEGVGFLRSDPALPAADVQFLAVPIMLLDEGLAPPTCHAFTVGAVVTKPTSRGRVTLRSPMPSAKPRILTNFLATPEDRATMLSGIRVALEIAAQPALATLLTGPFALPRSTSDADLLAHVRATAMSVWHPVGTCSMRTVVDAQLRVLGIDGLRVADASVMPSIPRANTNAATIMIGERAADLIMGRPSENIARQVVA
jgi:choline dehydrogenase-like flavoprotein